MYAVRCHQVTEGRGVVHVIEACKNVDYFIALCRDAKEEAYGQNCIMKTIVPPVQRAALWKEADVNG